MPEATSEETVVRHARVEDGPALAAIARSPIALGGVEVVVERGERFFEPFRLVEGANVVVAEVEGRPVGVYAGTPHWARVAGHDLRLLGLHQCRLLPAYQRGGIFNALAQALMGSFPEGYDAARTFIHPDNAAARRLTVVDPWSVRALRAVLPCAELAGPPAGRAARATDALAVATALNGLHGDEEMFVPVTPELLEARFGRAPDLYGWSNLVLGEGAVVGTWMIGERRRVSGATGTEESVRGWVLDYGCVPGAEAELVSLLRDRCRVAAEAGMTHLALYTSERSRSRPVLEPLASALEPYEVRTAFLPEPPGAARHGVHVDPLYF